MKYLNKIQPNLFSIKRLIISLILVFVTFFVVSGIFWWSMSETVSIQDEHIQSLNTRIETLSNNIESYSN